MTDLILNPHEAVCETLLRLDHASDIGVEIGVVASVFQRILGEYGYELAVRETVNRLGVVTLLAAVCRERGLSVHPDMLDEAIAGTLTVEQLEGIRGT